MSDLRQLLDRKRVVLCVGTGGVGKTTVAASLAVAAARAGKAVVVITIDPARRLADALGEGGLDHDPRPLGESGRAKLGLGPGTGSLHACTLDTQRTFDLLVERYAPDDATRRRIFDNRLYQHMADALAGSAEYAAMDRVFEIASDESFDLVVVDTPPATHALDFLDAPARLSELLESRLVHGLLQPAFAASRFGFRLFERGIRSVLGVIERVTGLGFLEDLSEFLIAIESLAAGFSVRAGELDGLLHSDAAAFLLITAPAPDRVRAGQRFLRQLGDSGIEVAGIIANRVQQWPAPDQASPEPRVDLDIEPERDRETGLEPDFDLEALTAALAARFGAEADAAAAAAVAVAKGYALVAASQRQSLTPLRAHAAGAGALFTVVPELAGDIHDLEGLAHVEEALFAEEIDS